MRRSTTFYDYRQAGKVQAKIEGILAEIASIAEASPSEGFELLCELLWPRLLRRDTTMMHT